MKDFTVWGTYNPSSDGLYYAGESLDVFEPNGSKVSAKDNGDGVFQPANDSNDKWVCSKTTYWNTGYYNFAAVYSSSQTAWDYSSTFSQTESEIVYTNELSISLNNFSLRNNQDDIIYAFHNENNSDGTSSLLNLNFHHLFSLLTINIEASNPSDLEALEYISLYGIHSRISGTLLLSQNEIVTKGNSDQLQQTSTISNNLDELFDDSDISVSTLPYKKVRIINAVTPIENLLVFPEILSEEHPLIIEVGYKATYEEDGVTKTETKTKIAKVTSGEWESGKTYVYTLLYN